MVSTTSLKNYEIRPSTGHNSKLSSASAVNAASPSTYQTQSSTLKRNSFNSNSSYTNSKNHKNQSPYNNSNNFLFNTSVSSHQADFYFRTLLRYVRSGDTDNYNEKLEFLLKQCPSLNTSKSATQFASSPPTNSSNSNSPTLNSHLHHHHHNSHHHHHTNNHNCSIRLTERSRSALIALMILIIENYHSINKKLKSLNSNGVKHELSHDLLNYLLNIFENMPNFKWIEDPLIAASTPNLTSGSKQSWDIFCLVKD